MMSRDPVPDDIEGGRQQGGGEQEVDPGLDALEGPVAVARLVGDELPEPGLAQACPEGVNGVLLARPDLLDRGGGELPTGRWDAGQRLAAIAEDSKGAGPGYGLAGLAERA